MANNERPSHTAARLLNALRADRYIARNFADELFQLGSLIDAIARDAEMRPVVNAVTDKVLADMLEGGAIVRIDPSAMFKTDSESDRLAALAGAAPGADELSRLYELAGYGGVSADAPERIILASSMYDGLECCDKWCCVDRVVDDGQPMPESATVYIRADLSHAPAKAREVTDEAINRALFAYDLAMARAPAISCRSVGIRAALATFAEGEE